MIELPPADSPIIVILIVNAKKEGMETDWDLHLDTRYIF